MIQMLMVLIIHYILLCTLDRKIQNITFFRQDTLNLCFYYLYLCYKIKEKIQINILVKHFNETVL